MKSFLYIILILSATIGRSQQYAANSPEGFGAAATGGGNADPTTVSTYTEFKNAIKSSGPGVILVSGIISIPTGQSISEIVIDKTILGLPGATLINPSQTKSGSGILNLKQGSRNVIIRNLIFEGAGAYDIDGRDNLTSDGCTDLWVDHCEFRDGVDGNFDIKGLSDNVTVSWCKFIYLKPPTPGGSGGSDDHRFSNLIGSSDSDAPVDGHYSVTFQNCYWAEGCRERMPRARNAQLHIFNCLYSTDVSSSRAIGISGGDNTSSCLVEKTDFESVGTVYRSYGGTVAINFEDCLGGRSNIGQVSAPNYTYTSFPVADVSAILKDEECGAGATLSISNSGMISSKCSTLGNGDINSPKFKIYPTIIESLLTIELVDLDLKGSSLSIFSLDGKKIYSNANLEKEGGKIQVDFVQQPPGVYLCQFSNKEKVQTFKVINRPQ
ncbi:pectate lyase [Nonlabens sp. YIK11]|uniref:pectate lyase family protein n=1 Tax=Nonlabens sp. YIK11 TaxID=1453349 RepID=UPI0006DC5CD5|nr:T9SS type A sorting domain-containing protein [Nonlabens sp. YIK11]KQC32689.1 pectate lyase [Nonlabens sp. YIK11]